MHGHLGGCGQTTGWAFVSKTLNLLKAENSNHLLFDNGDFLQGTALCDLMAFGALGPAENHPVIQVMNKMGYDAIGLGNHEFDFGLPFLRDALSGATAPLVCSNLETDQNVWERDLLINKSLTDSLGQPHKLTIGVFSLIPPQVLDWCRVHLEGQARAYEFQATAVERVTSLRSRGADLVFALCHAGDTASEAEAAKNPLATDITSIPGLDLVICGHTHSVSPKPGERKLCARNPSQSQDSVMPLVLPGDRGKFVGCIDLKLQKSPRGWTWVTAECRNIEVSETANPDVLEIAAPWITRAQTALAAEVGSSEIDIGTFFSAIQCDPATRLAAAAKQMAVAPLLEVLGYMDLPVVTAASPFRAGHDGPECYTAVPAGPVTLSEIYDIYPYFNAIDAFKITGAQARDWLEASVSGFFQLLPDQPDQPLWNHQFPTYEFDSLLGVSYQIDLSKPALYSPDRRRLSEAACSRICDLSLSGEPLDPHAEMILVTNAYRGGGGGKFPHISSRNRIPLPFRDVRAWMQVLFSRGLTENYLPAPSWQFAPMAGTSAIFKTGSDALRFIPSNLKQRLTDLGETAGGYRKFRLSL